MTDIARNISDLKTHIPSSVKLVAVSKTKPVCDIMEAYNAGQRYFGENRVQELLNKKDLVPHDIEWHLIGHLQSNKVKLIVPFINMIQSVDSYRLLKVINSEAIKINKVVDCLLQIHIATEETKFGFSINEIDEMTGSDDFKNLDFVRICGVMGMATFTSDSDQVRKEFHYLARCFNDLKNRYFTGKPHFKEISMGMSGDYEVALKEGSTIVRVGSLIFGERIKT
jgi:pyridoxal phosphate enzyme (YggS family)